MIDSTARFRPPRFIREELDRIKENQNDPAFEVPGMPPNFGEYAVPHLLTYSSLHGTFSRVYRPSDEALKHSLENARYMRNDPGIMECVEARQRSVALLDWHLEPEDENSAEQKELVEKLTKIIEEIPRFVEYRTNLLHAIWYGKSAIQHRYGWNNIGGRMYLMPKRRRDNPGWLPIHGDKLVFRYDDGTHASDQPPDQLGIRVGHGNKKGDMINSRWKIEPTGRGLAYFLSDWERKSFAVHKHMIEDGAWEDNQSGEQIHGVGIRSRIYWDWFQKQESLAFLMEYLERSAGGIEIWTYPSGDAGALAAAKTAAKERMSNGRNIVFFPKPMGDGGDMYDIQVVEPGMGGIESLKDILQTYYGHRIKRYILGQVLSSEAEATGLGSGVAELHYNTYLQIVKYDAVNLQESITHDLVRPIQLWNFPRSRGFQVKFKIETESPDVEKKLEAWRQAWDMGAKLRERDVMDMIGAESPTGDDTALENPQFKQGAEGMGGGMPGMGMPMDADGDGIAGEGTPNATSVRMPINPQGMTDEVMQQLWGDPEAAEGGSVSYVNEGGNWVEREVPAFDTGDRRTERRAKKFSRPFRSGQSEKYKQAIDSAGTSLNQVPALFKRIGESGGWKRGAVNIDVGGGKYDKGTMWLSQRGVTNFVYDPYNRDPAHNHKVIAQCKGKAQTATLANVLNVIAEPEEQHKALMVAKGCVAPGGMVYIDVHEGDRSGRGAKTSRGFQQNQPISAYLPIVQRVFPQAELAGGIIVATNGGATEKHSIAVGNLIEVDRYRKDLKGQRKLFDDEPEGEWKTINGTAVFIEGGEITKGPKNLLRQKKKGGDSDSGGDGVEGLPTLFGSDQLPELNILNNPGDPNGDLEESSTDKAVDLLPIEDYDKVLVQFSGGKDSVASVLDLLDQGVPKDKIELWHQKIDGDNERFMDWPVTHAYVKAVADHLGLPIKFQWREGGFKREMLRENQKTGGVWYEDEDGNRKFLEPSSRGKESTRRKFPAKSADLSVRWCSAAVKIDVASRALTNDPSLQGTKDNPKKLLFVTGERREEGGRRSQYLEAEEHRSHAPSKRVVHHYRPVIDYTESEVWDKLKEHGINPHPAYHLGYNRLSCQHCIYADPDQVASNIELDPEGVQLLADHEEAFGHTINTEGSGKKLRAVPIHEWGERGKSFVADKPQKLKDLAMSQAEEFGGDVTVKGEWKNPAGAFKRQSGPYSRQTVGMQEWIAVARYSWGYERADVQRDDKRRYAFDESQVSRDNRGRFTHRRDSDTLSDNVMLFSGDDDNLHYGEHEWTLRTELPNVNDDQRLLAFTMDYYDVDEDEARELLNPSDIVDNAGAWDDSQFVSDVWQEFEPTGYQTDNGAVVLDREAVELDYRHDIQHDEYKKRKDLPGQQTLWNEDDHPRKLDGTFTEKGHGELFPGSHEPKKRRKPRKRKPVASDAGQAHDGPSAAGKKGDGQRVRSLFDVSDGSGDRSTGAAYSPGDTAGDSPATSSDRPIPRPVRDRGAGNYRYGSRDFIPKGLKTKFQANLAAIKVLRTLDSEGREHATPEEQETLSKFTGWGQFPNLFSSWPGEWEKEQAQLKQLLSDDEYKGAKESAGDVGNSRGYQEANRALLNSHFTDPRVVDMHWKIAQRLGFTGGRYLEPSVGSGYYLGMMPEELSKTTSVTGIELDSTTAAVAQKLYPSATIRNQGFETYQTPDNFFDLAASNVPFGEYTLHEDRYNRFRALIHDHFFLKSLDKVRPGGLVMHVTSAGTLDKSESKIRRELAKKADLVAAVRLPGGIHKAAANTEVVTDLIILRKRGPEGAAPSETPSEVKLPEPGFTGVLTDSLGRVYHFVNGKRVPADHWTQTTTIPDPDGGEPIPINQYFVDNPDQVIGTINRTGTMYGPGRMNVTPPEDLDAAFQAAVDRMPEGVYQAATAPDDRFDPDGQPAADDVREGNYVVKDGEIWQRRYGILMKADVPKNAVGRITDAIEIRGALRDVLRNDLAGESSDEARAKLNDAYDEFVSNHGVLHAAANLKALHDDPDLPLMLSLEKWDKDTKSAEKADIFERNTVRPDRSADSADNATEALTISLNELGSVDVDHMAKLTGQSRAEIEDELRQSGLAFDDPEVGWTPREEYLSGNVKRKLRMARVAAENDDIYQTNVDALEEHQPADIDIEDIAAKLGVPWVPEEDMNAFAAHLLNTTPDNFQIRYSNELGKWQASWTRNARSWVMDGAAADAWTVDNRHKFIHIMDAALNNKSPKIYTEDSEGKRKLDEKATDEVAGKIQELRDEFSDWLWDDAERRERLHRHYNDNYNDTVPMEYDGRHLTLPGYNTETWDLRDVQKNAVWQVIRRGRGLIAHEVGVGKTATMVASAMELRRLGLARKPAILCKASNVDQIAMEAQELYPGAKIINTSRGMTADKRKETVARMATGDYDMIIMTHENLEALPVSEAVQAQYIRDEIEELNATLDQVKLEDPTKRNRTAKDLEKKRANLEAKLKKALEGRKDDAVTFEETGIDFLFVDEAHRYKNAPITTAMTQLKGINPTGSSRAADMMMKTRYLHEMNNGRGVVFATGTPVSNTMGELYNIQKFIQPEVLKEHGLDHFDTWANTFGEFITDYEPDPLTKEGYKESTRFSRFVNIPELMQMVRADMDVRRVANLFNPDGKPMVPRPNRHDHMVVTPQTGSVADAMADIRKRAERIIGRKTEKGEDNKASLTQLGRVASIDPRMYDASLPDDPNSKTNHMVRNVLERYHDPDHAGQTQLIFSDLGVQPVKSGFHLYPDLIDKLVAGGIPRDQIVDFSTLTRAKKLQAALAIKRGEKRIGIGSTEKLGTGNNVQTHLSAVHHLDIPYRPSDLEQRDGRAHRNGNKNKDIDIYSYVTEKSLDEMSYGIVGRKAEFISQAITDPKSGVRTIDEEDTEALTPQQLMAAASGDTRQLDLVNLKRQVKQLTSARNRHERSQRGLASRIQNATREAAQLRERAAQMTSDAKHLEDTPEFHMLVNGQSTTTRSVAEEALKAAGERWDKEYQDTPSWQRRDMKSYLGTYRGMDVHRMRGGFMLEGKSGQKYPTGDSLRSIESVAKRISTRADEAKTAAAQIDRDIASIEKQQGKVFRRADELADLKKKMDDLQAELDSERKKEQNESEQPETEKHSRFARQFSSQLADRYCRRMNVDRYEWITIGSNKAAPEGSKGGTPVKLDESGQITAGPKGLEGKSVKQIAKPRSDAFNSWDKKMAKVFFGESPSDDQHVKRQAQQWAEQKQAELRTTIDEFDSKFNPGDNEQIDKMVDGWKKQLHAIEAHAGRPKRQQRMFGQSPEATPVTQNKPTTQPLLFDPATDSIEEAPKPAFDTAETSPLRQGRHSRFVGSTVMNASDIKADPDRFQYKVSGIGAKGVTSEFKGVARWNPVMAGTVTVWHDPEDGQTYVINGHHRLELSQRAKGNKLARMPHEMEHDPVFQDDDGNYNGAIQVNYLDASTAEKARAMGALANIAEGRGTATDAAKFFRETNATKDDLEDYGVSLSGRIANPGMDLAKLSPKVFGTLVNGGMTESRGLAIQRNLIDHDKQNELLGHIQRAEERRGDTLSDGAVSNMARRMALAPDVEGGGGLFDDYMQESTFAEWGMLSDWMRQKISGEMRTFKSGASGTQAERLKTAGNVIDTDANAARAAELAMALYDYDTVALTKGHPVSQAIGQAAVQLKENPNNEQQIKQQLGQTIREILQGGGGSRGDRRGSEAPEGGPDPAGGGLSTVEPGPGGATERREPGATRDTARQLGVMRHRRGSPGPEREYVRDDHGRFAETGSSSKTAQIAKTAIKVANAAPIFAAEVAREAGVSERTAMMALAAATVVDWATPGMPIGSAIVIGLSSLKDPKAAYHAAQKLVRNLKGRSNGGKDE